MLRRRVASFALACVLAASASARADAPDDARAHFSAGVRLYDAHDYGAALAEFQAAYAVKRSPQIKRNIALCLRGLGRYPEALEALEEMLAEGGDTLKPDVKDAAKQAIAEMSALVGTVTVRVVYTGRTPPSSVAVTIDDHAVATERLAKPVRLLPGEHVFRAVATGYFQAEQRARVVAGQPDTAVDLGLVAVEVAARGKLNVQTNVTGAKVAIDGVIVGVGAWSGELAAGEHRIDATAQGYPSQTVTVNVPAGGTESVSVDMTGPPPYVPDVPPVHVQRLWYLSGGLGIFGESLRTTALALDDPSATKRSFGGAGLVVHGGRKLGAHLAVGLVGEIGAMATSTYASASANGLSKDNVTVIQWVLAPEIRLMSSGKLRGFGGLALGVEGTGVSAKLPQGATTLQRTETGSGVGGIVMLEGGGQFELGRAFVEAALFVDGHGVGATNANGDRYFADSPVARAGLRLLVGYTF
jgi:PEGA domain